MSHNSEQPNGSKRGVVILLTLALHLALGFYLYQQSTSPTQAEKVELRQSGVDTTP